MSQSNATDENATPQQKVLLPNPFDLDDSKILERVYLTHLHDEDKCDVDILWNIVSNVLQTTSAEGITTPTGFQPDYRTMKLISCQMITTPCGERYVHQTTMWILQHLKTYSWYAKALVAVAAFALEYGNLLHLTELVSTPDQLSNSLKQLNQVQNRKVPVNNLVELVIKALQNIQEWATWSAVGYNTLEVPSLSDALHEVPVVVYWILASIIAATGNLVGVSEYSLSDFTAKLSSAVSRLQKHLNNSKEQIDYLDEYLRRKKAFSNPKDIVELLKLLIQPNESVIVYDGSTQKEVDIEVFRQKHVLLFISSLDKVDDEILLLKSLHVRLGENPKEIIKGYKKEDFKILWIPIVTVWDESQVHKFHTLKDKIKWYGVEYLHELPGTGLIKEKFNYMGNPIIPVLTPLGDIMNEDAMDLIFQWGIDAFPFRKIDGIDLTLKWKWFWDVTKKVNLGVQVKGDRYIFIYGGSDKKWIQDFTLAVEKTRRHATISKADAIIEHYQLGRNDPKVVPRFWIEIESKKLKKHKGALDCKIQEIVKILQCLKQDPQGWAILTKGSNVKLLGHGEPMYQTLADFEIWKEEVLETGFDIAFKKYYDAKLKEIYDRQPCAYMNVDNNTANVLATITCPNPTCGRVMEVTSVHYKCCHRDAQNTSNI